MYIKNLDELRIYKIALELAIEIAELVKSVPFYWKNKDVGQILRSSSSVPSNIAEGFSHRFYPRKFLHSLIIALGEGDETQNHLKLLSRKKNLGKEAADRYLNRYKNLCIKILNFINYLKKKHSITI